MVMPAGNEPDVVAMLEDELGLDEELTLRDTHGYELRPLDIREIKSVIQLEINDALGGLGSEIADDRQKAIRYYYGRPFGNEIDGRSQVVLTDVKDTIEWVMPQLMRMFTGGTHIVEYEPRRQGQEQQAKQATEFVNYLFMDEQDGFRILYDLFKTALLEKNSPGKVYSEKKYEPMLERYNGLSEAELGLLLDDEGLEVVAHDVEEKTLGRDPETGEPIVEKLYNVQVRHMQAHVDVRVAAIPPEEFLIARRTIRLDDTTQFTAHRVKRTASDLIAMGFPKDLVLSVPSDDTPEFSIGRTERLSEDETFPVTTAERADAASREIWTTDCVLRMDTDGDGYAELHKFIVAGENTVEILDDVEISHNPFFDLCPIPMPHKFHGMSLADLIMDLQLIRSTLLRQMLDNLYLINNQRMVVLDGEVDLDDLLTSRPGGIVRANQLDAVRPLEQGQLGPMAMAMMEYLEEVKQNRTGITRYTQGMDASSLNQTATGISRIMDAAQVRIELIARIFAQTGLKRMFKLLLREMIQAGVKDRVFRLRGEWVTVDPSQWDEDMDVRIKVGLGVGQAQERIANLQTILQLQTQLTQMGFGEFMVTPANAFNALEGVAEAMGFPIPEHFFTDPGDREAPEPTPDPKVLEIEMKKELEAARLELEKERLSLKEREDALDAELRKEEILMRERVEMARIESQERIGLQKCEIDREKNRNDAQRKREAA